MIDDSDPFSSVSTSSVLEVGLRFIGLAVGGVLDSRRARDATCAPNASQFLALRPDAKEDELGRGEGD